MARPQKPTWTDRVASATWTFLKKKHETKGLTYEEVRNRLLNAEWAAHYNPSWGPVLDGKLTLDGFHLVALKHYCSGYYEARFHTDAVAFSPKWKTWSRGWRQINDCHTFAVGPGSAWFNFCKIEGIDPKNPKNLWNPEYNAKFACYLNEAFVRGHRDTYKYCASTSSWELYDTLLKVTGLTKLGLEYNDGQYALVPPGQN